MARRARRGVPRGDRLLTFLLVTLALIVGAFLSSLIYRWTDASRDAQGGMRVARRAQLEPAEPVDRGRIRVEVLNAARVPGLADRMTGLLRSRGFDVVNYGNAPGSERGPSSILDRSGNARFAREVALELPGTPIRRDLSPDGFIDITVIVGEDYRRLFSDPRGDSPPAGRLRKALDAVRGILGA